MLNSIPNMVVVDLLSQMANKIWYPQPRRSWLLDLFLRLNHQPRTVILQARQNERGYSTQAMYDL